MSPTSIQRRSGATTAVLLTLVLTAAACGSSKNATATSEATTTTSPLVVQPSIASQLVLGGPTDCPFQPFCMPGLQTVYGIRFKGFKALDLNGPLTYGALTSGTIQVAVVFSSDAQILVDNLVVLKDDKHLQNADDVVPAVSAAKATPGVITVTNAVSAKLTTAGLIALNKSVSVDQQDPQTVADAWLSSNGFATTSTTAAGSSLTVAGFTFPESTVLSYLYGDALKHAGASVTIKANYGDRSSVEPALRSGLIDFVPEYAASMLGEYEALEGLASGREEGVPANQLIAKLRQVFAAKGVTVLDPTQALDTDAFAVTRRTADKYGLVNMSDLTKPHPG